MKVYVLDTETFEKEGVPHLRLLVWKELGEKEIHHVDTFLEPKRAERVARELLKNVVVGHNLAFDLPVLWRFLGEVVFPPDIWDTMISHQVLDFMNQARRDRSRVALAHLSEKLFRVKLDKSFQDPREWEGTLTEKHIEYAKKDVEMTERLFLYQKEKLVPKYMDILSRMYPFAMKTHTSKVFGKLPVVVALENRVVPIFAHMTYTGVGIDMEGAEKLVEEREREEKKLTQEFYEEWRVFPSEKRKIAKRLCVESVKIDFLKALKRPSMEIRKYIEFAEVYNRIKKEKDKAKELLEHQRNGRVFPKWWQIGAPTGRVASSSPQVQNLPRSSEVRKLIRAEEGKTLIIADFSQIELRIASVIVPKFLKNLRRKRPTFPLPPFRMKEVSEKGIDAHTYMASVVTGKSMDEVEKQERQLAKGINFGLLYGQTSLGFQRYLKTKYGIEVDEGKAQELIRKYYEAYPEVRIWHRIQKDDKDFRITTTLWGRMMGAFSRNDALNYPVQGTGADLLKYALLLYGKEVEGQIRAGEVAIVMTVHDEIVVEASEEIAEEAELALLSAMRRAGEKLLREVPVGVETERAEVYAK